VYYQAREKALSNEHTFHLAAVLKRGDSVIRIGINSGKTSPRFARKHKNGAVDYHLHAEMDALCFSRPGDTVIVVRFTADGQLTMAKPCEFCQGFLKQAGINKIYFSNWNGEYEKL
jgi:deoxycytidylate deaminase